MIPYIISYRVNHLSNASILDAPVTIQELCTCLLNSSTDICCTPDRIQLVCPVQLLPWTFAIKNETDALLCSTHSALDLLLITLSPAHTGCAFKIMSYAACTSMRDMRVLARAHAPRRNRMSPYRALQNPGALSSSIAVVFNLCRRSASGCSIRA